MWDLGLGATLFVVAGAVAAFHMRELGPAFFYQTQMPAAVMAACGREFAQPLDLPQKLLDFLFLRARTFDCRDLAPVTGTRSIGYMTQSHLYLAATVTALWRWLGVSYASLWPMYALFHGSYAAGGFALGRLFFGRPGAVFLGAVLAASPVALAMLFLFRDYAKAPFFIWSLVLVVLAIRERRPWRLILISAALGGVVGIGAGFRSDVMLVVPIALGTLTVGLAWTGLPTSTRLLAPASFLVVVVALAAPLVPKGGSNISGFLMMQGATEPFRAHLGLGPAPYDFGARYSDELTLSSIAADLRARDPTQFAKGESEPFEGLTQTLTRSTGYVAGWLPFFLADTATRALKSAVLVAGFPTLLAPERRIHDPHKPVFPAPTALGQATGKLALVAAQPWMPALGVLGLVAFLCRVFARSRREAACLGAAILVLIATPSIQFALRHLFHLEFVFWLGLLALAAVPFTWADLRAHLRAYLTWVLGLAVLVAAVYGALILLQDHLVAAEIRRLLASPREVVAVEPKALPSGQVLLQVPVPAVHAELVTGPPDSLVLPSVETVTAHRVTAAADRLALEVGGAGCPTTEVEIKLTYQPRAGIWQPLDRALVVSAPNNVAERTILITPAFYRATQHFNGIEVASAQRPCITAVFRLHDARHLPAVLTFKLRPGWDRNALHLPLTRSLGPAIAHP